VLPNQSLPKKKGGGVSMCPVGGKKKRVVAIRGEGEMRAEIKAGKGKR